MNFRKKIALEKMAYDLGISKYMLSKIFSKTFHCNFTAYVNGMRLNYAVSMLDGTKESIFGYLLIAFHKMSTIEI